MLCMALMAVLDSLLRLLKTMIKIKHTSLHQNQGK